MKEQRILVKIRDGLGEVRINRPEKLNALTEEMLKALSAEIRRLPEHEDVRAIILTGEGKAFSAGDDLKESLELNKESFGSLIDSFQDVTRAIVSSPLPVIAAVNGLAVGGAAEITLACDVRIGGPDTEFFFPENGIGLTISNASTVFIPALIGKRAMGVVLMERRISIGEAFSMGLVDAVADSTEEVVQQAQRIATRLGEDTASTMFHLSLLRPSRDEIEIALETEREAASRAWESGLVQKGVARFWKEKLSQT